MSRIIRIYHLQLRHSVLALIHFQRMARNRPVKYEEIAAVYINYANLWLNYFAKQIRFIYCWNMGKWESWLASRKQFLKLKGYFSQGKNRFFVLVSLPLYSLTMVEEIWFPLIINSTDCSLYCTTLGGFKHTWIIMQYIHPDLGCVHSAWTKLTNTYTTRAVV